MHARTCVRECVCERDKVCICTQINRCLHVELVVPVLFCWELSSLCLQAQRKVPEVEPDKNLLLKQKVSLERPAV